VVGEPQERVRTILAELAPLHGGGIVR
jgi:hypothetical protein